jgi:ATP-dependent Lhr-like helicase
VWAGVEPLGDRDGRIALYLADHLTRLLPPDTVRLKADTTSIRGASKADTTSFRGTSKVDPTAAAGNQPDRGEAIAEYLRTHGASFFAPLHEASGGGYPAETVDALWDLVWSGLVTNDTFHALRAFTRSRAPRRRARRAAPPAFRSRRLVPPAAEGRWSLIRRDATVTATRWAAAITQQLLARHGVLTREAAGAENVAGGFGVIYPVLKAMEEHGRIRRGYFVSGLGATQFALPGALDLLRSLRAPADDPEIVVLAATDPANPYGTALRFPDASGKRGPTRSVGATVILVDGALVAYLARGDRQLLTWLPEAEPQRSRAGRAIATVLIERARTGDESPRGMLIEEIDAGSPAAHPMAPWLVEAGFISGAMGFQATYPRPDSRPPRVHA